MVRLLLGVPEVHEPLSSWLLEKMAIVSLDNEDCTVNSKLSLPQLILSQLRWLDPSVARVHLVDKVLEVLEGSSFLVQELIITSLPEIVADVYHSKIAIALRDRMDKDLAWDQEVNIFLKLNGIAECCLNFWNSCKITITFLQHRLTNAIIDTMSNLTLKPEVPLLFPLSFVCIGGGGDGKSVLSVTFSQFSGRLRNPANTFEDHVDNGNGRPARHCQVHPEEVIKFCNKDN